MSAFALLIRPAGLTAHLQPLTERSSTIHNLRIDYESTASVISFSPGKSSAQADSTSELLRFL